jgi:hypothetical protein
MTIDTLCPTRPVSPVPKVSVTSAPDVMVPVSVIPTTAALAGTAAATRSTLPEEGPSSREPSWKDFTQSKSE